MGLLQSVAAAVACMLILPTGSALGQSNPTPAEQLREMAKIIQANGAPVLDHLGRTVEGSKQCLMTDNGLRSSSQVTSDGTNILTEEIITSSAERRTYYLSRTFETTPKGQGVEITEPFPVVFLKKTPNSQAEILSPQQIAQAPDVIFKAYHAQATPEKLFEAMRVAVYGACLKVEPPSPSDRASVYGGLSVAGAFSGQSTFSM